MPKNISFYVFLALLPIAAAYILLTERINAALGLAPDAVGPLDAVAIFICVSVPIASLAYLLYSWLKKPQPPAPDAAPPTP